MSAYSPRIVDGELRELLGSAGAVVIERPKACGKTMTASQQSASRVLLDIDQAARQALAVEPRLVLEGARPRLLDEWQVAPELWNQVRRAGGRCQPPHRRRTFRVPALSAQDLGELIARGGWPATTSSRCGKLTSAEWIAAAIQPEWGHCCALSGAIAPLRPGS